MHLFLDAKFCSTVSYVYPMSVSHCLADCGFITVKLDSHFSKLGNVSLPTLFFFLNIVLASFGSMHFHMNLSISFLISAKMLVGILIWIALELYFNLRRIAILRFCLPIHQYGMSFHLLRSLNFFQHCSIDFQVTSLVFFH